MAAQQRVMSAFRIDLKVNFKDFEHFVLKFVLYSYYILIIAESALCLSL